MVMKSFYNEPQSRILLDWGELFRGRLIACRVGWGLLLFILSNSIALLHPHLAYFTSFQDEQVIWLWLPFENSRTLCGKYPRKTHQGSFRRLCIWPGICPLLLFILNEGALSLSDLWLLCEALHFLICPALRPQLWFKIIVVDLKKGFQDTDLEKLLILSLWKFHRSYLFMDNIKSSSSFLHLQSMMLILSLIVQVSNCRFYTWFTYSWNWRLG